MDVDLGVALGAQAESSTQRLVLYIPNKDKDGRELQDQERWVKEIQELLSHIGGGSTTFPPADGTWSRQGLQACASSCIASGARRIKEKLLLS